MVLAQVFTMKATPKHNVRFHTPSCLLEKQNGEILRGNYVQTTVRSFIHRDKLKLCISKMETHKYPHTNLAPLTLGNSCVKETISPSRRVVPELTMCVDGSPTTSSRYFSTTHTSFGSSAHQKDYAWLSKSQFPRLRPTMSKPASLLLLSDTHCTKSPAMHVVGS